MGDRSGLRKRSLNAAAATGAGEELVTDGRSRVSWDYVTAGSPTGVSIKLQYLSYPGGTWRDAPGGALTDTTGGSQIESVPIPCTSFRLNLTTLSGGTTPTVTGWIVATD